MEKVKGWKSPSTPGSATGSAPARSFSTAASSTAVATPSMASVTSSSGGIVGARRMFSSFGSWPRGKDEPAGVSAIPASLASETTRDAVPGMTSRLTK